MKIAINTTVIGKPQSGDNATQAKLTTSYQNVDISSKELASHVQQGYAYCAQHRNNHRKSVNFIASDFLSVDIDSGMTLNQAQENLFIQNFASFIYTTSSHTQENNRFRIVFELEDTVTNKQKMKNLYSGLSIQFGGDKACTDACHQFYGSKDCDLIFFNKTLPNHKLTNFFILANESKTASTYKGSTSKNNHSVIRSNITINNDTTLTDSHGLNHRLIDLPIRTKVHCPIHQDNNASAFVVQSKTGVHGVHCTTCQKTFFTSNEFPHYDFDYALHKLKNLSKEQIHHEKQEGLVTYPTRSVYYEDEMYLSPKSIDSTVVFVKSPKGSGKTQWLESVVKASQKRRTKQKVLLIGHRQSLITALAHRLNLTPYISPALDSETKLIQNPPSSHYAICADSLSTRLNSPSNHQYPIVIIDEVEQVLTHLTQDTVKDKRNETFIYFKHYLNEAKKVYVMDADLGELTINTLSDLIEDGSKSVTVIVNKYKPSTRSISLYENENHLISNMVDDALSGKKLLVCCNSKKQVNNLHESLTKSSGGSLKLLMITSKNSQKPEIQKFISNIKTEIKNFDVVLVSPTLGTGVDITFPNSEEYIDVVYGFFQPRVNTHFDIDQQLSRVRHPKEVRIWISPLTFRFETDPTIIKQEVNSSINHSLKLVGIKDGREVYDSIWSDEYLNLYVNVKSIERGSKNNLLYNFRQLKESQGWKIKDVTFDESSKEKGKIIKKESKEILKQRDHQNLLSSKIITDNEYKFLKGKSTTTPLTNNQEFSLRRYEIELFYLQTIDEDLIDLDNNWKYRKLVVSYENYTQNTSDLKIRDLKDIEDQKHITDSKALVQKQNLLQSLLQSSGLSDENNLFLVDIEITKDDLVEFVQLCKTKKNELSRLFDMDINRDIDKKPTSQLSKILNKCGLKWRSRSTQVEGQKVYLYSIHQSDIDQLEIYVSRRKDQEFRKNWNLNQENTTENRLFDNEFRDLSFQFGQQKKLERSSVL